MPKYFLLIITISISLTYGQNPKETLAAKSTSIVFKDTVHNLAFDSISHNLGSIVPTNENNQLTKHFIYVGTEPIYITGAWTSDPHFICEYPIKDTLVPNKIYSFTICFWHKEMQGNMAKTMGFYLSDGNKISLKFTGTYLQIEEQDH